MTVSAEFATSLPGTDELLVHLYDKLNASSKIERFYSNDSTIRFNKQWNQSFPKRIIWFVGDKDMIEVKKGFISVD
jgi:hypothetical protein